jgi:1,4-alpha-glucan branching enzyme
VQIPRVGAARHRGLCIGAVQRRAQWQEASQLVKDSQGSWDGFVRDVKEGAEYKFFVVGPTGLEGYKRDPRARELSAPDWNGIVRDPSRYLWHDAQFRTPPFEDLIIYQFHIGTLYAVDPVGR